MLLNVTNVRNYNKLKSASPLLRFSSAFKCLYKNSNLQSSPITGFVHEWKHNYTAMACFMCITQRLESCAVWWRVQPLHWELWCWTGLKLKLRTAAPRVWSQRLYQRKRSCFPAREENSAHCALSGSLQNTDKCHFRPFQYALKYQGWVSQKSAFPKCCFFCFSPN